MTKNEIRKELEAGKPLDKILAFTDGQECDIYKGSWPEKPAENLYEVIYIPDVYLNGIDISSRLNEDDINDAVSYCYTVGDFIREGYGNVKLAEDLFDQCDWQNPNVQDLMDCTDEEEALHDYGETWLAMSDRSDRIELTRKELYRLYQLDWMAYHGQSVDGIIRECQKAADGFISEGYGGTESIRLDLATEFEENGFDGSIYASFDEFLRNEYRDSRYMLRLMESSLIKENILERYYRIDMTPVYKDGRAEIISLLCA